jgi:glycosyltransferase involved in cell wall biosynthesis
MEAVESFRRQLLDGVKAELLILNDNPDQHLTCKVPGVRIVQGMNPYRTLSDKWNAGVEMASGRWIACWDDDDISLPARLSQSVEVIGGHDLFSNMWCWSMCDKRGVIDQIGRTWLCSSMFRRDAFIREGGCISDKWNDRVTYEALRKSMVSQSKPDYDRIQYVYRWAGEMHDSGHGEDAALRVERFRAAVLNDSRFVRGEFELIPWWTMDYEAEVESAKQRKVKVARE